MYTINDKIYHSKAYYIKPGYCKMKNKVKMRVKKQVYVCI